MISLFWFFAHIFSKQCNYNITAGIGMHKVTQNFKYGESLCINITYYPFYIAFYDASPELEYNEYYSRSSDRKNPKDFTALGKKLVSDIVFRAIELPYGSITITSRHTSEFIKFVYFSMPGLCQTGVYFSYRYQELIRLTPSGKDFLRLRNYDDKCVIFIPPFPTTVKFMQSSQDQTDQFFVYRNFTDYEVYAGTFFGDVSYDSNESYIFRILTNGDITPDVVSVGVEPWDEMPLGNSKYFIPRHKEPECEVVQNWCSEELVITLIACCAFFVVLLVVIVSCRCYDRCRSNPRSFYFHSVD